MSEIGTITRPRLKRELAAQRARPGRLTPKDVGRACLAIVLAGVLGGETASAQCEATLLEPIEDDAFVLTLNGHNASLTFRWISSGCGATDIAILFPPSVLFSHQSDPVPVSAGVEAQWTFEFNESPMPQEWCWSVPHAPQQACFTVATIPGATPTPTPAAEPGGFPSKPAPTPLEATDRRYVVDSGPGLNTTCQYNTDPDIIIHLPIDRYLGPVDQFGWLQNAAAQISNGTLAAFAELKIEAWDVDAGGGVLVAPEIDKVYFNGVPLQNPLGAANGILTGQGGQWSETRFIVPISWVRFRERGVNGQPPPDDPLQRNEIKIDVDTGNTHKVWCTSIASVSLSFKAISPVILVHGNGSDPGFWSRQGFAPTLAGLEVPFDDSVVLDETSIEQNGWELGQVLPGIVEEFGVDRVHLVAHSKGGLDSREFLAKYGGAFEVVSLVTLSTPHRGVGTADFALSRERFGGAFNSGIQVNVLSLAAALGRSGLFDVTDGRRDLTVGHAGRFNRENVGKVALDTIIQVIGADSNTDNDFLGRLDYTDDNLAALVSESPDLAVFHQAAGDFAVQNLFSIVYRFLKDNSVLVPVERSLPVPAVFVSSTLLSGGGPNDIFVTTFSAEGPPNSGFEVQPHFLGSNGRNHSDVIDPGVAQSVFGYLLETDARNGGFK